ncbi:MAG: inositol monophosphatase family protein [Candidatus Omnitrophota bacterium]
MRYVTKTISCVLVIAFLSPTSGECLRPIATSLIEEGLSVDKNMLKAVQIFLGNRSFKYRITNIQYMIMTSKDIEQIKAVLWIAFTKSNYSTDPKAIFNRFTFYSRLDLISKCLSLSLKRKDSDEVARFLKHVLELADKSIMPEARKLISSYLTVYEIKNPIKVATIIGVYTEQRNIQPKSSKNTEGKDYLKSKIEQLNDLYVINPKVRHQLVIVQDGDDGRFYNGRKSIDIARDVINEEFPDAIDRKEIVLLELSQETREKIGSVKGGAIMYGLRWALDNGIDYAITTDADLASHGGEEGLLLDSAINKGTDLAIGSIFKKDSIAPSRPMLRRVRSRVWLWLEKKMLPQLIGLSDTQRSFKCYNRGAMEVLIPVDSDDNFDENFNYGLSFEGNILALAVETALFMDEVGIIWVDFPGTSTIVPKYILQMIMGLGKTRRFLKNHIDEYMERGRTYVIYKNLKAQQVITEVDEDILQWDSEKAKKLTLGKKIEEGLYITEYEKELKAFEELAIKVADVLIDIRRKNKGIIDLIPEVRGKGVTTIYDKILQDLYIKELSELFREWRFIAEEGAIRALLDLEGVEHVCIIDPIDGSEEFARKSDYLNHRFKPMLNHKEYGTGIALCKRLPDGKLKPLISVSVLPEIDIDGAGFSIVEAMDVDGIRGTFLNGDRIEASRFTPADLKSRDVFVEPSRGHLDIAEKIATEFKNGFTDVSTFCHASMLASGEKYSNVAGSMLARPRIWDSVISGFIAQMAGAKIVYLSDGSDFFPLDTERVDDGLRTDNIFMASEGVVSHILRVLHEANMELPVTEKLTIGIQTMLPLISQAA